MTDHLAIFEGHKIRRVYDEKTEARFFSVVGHHGKSLVKCSAQEVSRTLQVA